MADTPLIDREILLDTFSGSVSIPPSSLPNIPFRPPSTPIPTVDGSPTPSALSAIENSVLSIPSNKGMITGGSISRSLEEVTSSRFDTFVPGDYNNEDAYAQGQGWPSKMVNGIGKGLLLTGTTLLQTTVGSLNGIARMTETGRAASFYDNDLNRWLDEVNKAAENVLPNYYTDVEKNSHWYSPSKLFTANFLWDGIVKNLGYAGGAALSGLVFSTALRALPLTARLFSVGKAGEALMATEEGLLAANKVADTFGKVKSLSDKFLSSYSLLNGTGRALVAGLSTTGEAGFEAFHNLNTFRDQKIQEWKDSHVGQSPKGSDLDTINSEADRVGNSSFLLNTALLSATNYIQFPKILGSSYAAERGIINSLKNDVSKITQDATGTFVRQEAKTRTGRILAGINRIRPYTFSTSEGFEEGAQFAISVGTQDYYNKKYDGDTASFLGSVIEGVTETFGTDEGMENIIVGGLAGAIMLGRGRFKSTAQKSRNTADAVQKFNNWRISDFTKDTIDSVNRGTTLQKERESLLRQGDIMESKEKETDYIINYLTPRIKYGRYDLVEADINEYKQLASTDVGFAQLQSEGKALSGDTRTAYLQRLINLENTADNIKSLYQSLTLRYGGAALPDGSAKYPQEVMDQMIYAATKVADYDKRIPELTLKLSLQGVIVSPTFIPNVSEGGTSEFNRAANEITKMNVISEQKDIMRETLTDLKELVRRRRLFLEEYDEIKKNPTKFTNSYKEQVQVAEAGKPVISPNREYTTEDIEKAVVHKLSEEDWQVKVGDIVVNNFPTKEEAEGERDNFNIDLQSSKKIRIIQTNADGSVKVEDLNGNIFQLSKNEFEKYELIETEQEKLRSFKNELDIEQSDVEKSSGNNPTNDLPKDIGFATWEEKKKAASKLYNSTTSQSEDWEASSIKPHNLRTIEFLNNVKNFPNYSNIRAILVTPNQENSLGLEGLAALSLDGLGLEQAKYTDINEGLVAAIYVEQQGKDVYFVNKDGKRLSKVGEKTDLNQVVFSTMPTTHLVWRDGKTPRYRDGEKEAATEQAKRWEVKRKQLFNLPNGKYEIYSFNISRGIPNIIDDYKRNYVGNTLVPESKISTQEGLIVVPITDTIFHQGELLKFPNGRPVLQYKDTLQFLSNNTFNKDQTSSIFEVIKLLSQDVKKQAGAKIRLNRQYTKFLQNLLYYKDSSQFSKNQFFIDTTSMEVKFGDSRWDITKIEEFEKEIKDKLLNTYNSVNNFTLTKLFNEPFTELYLEENVLKDRKWTNYQTYLLSSTYPDGKTRHIDDLPLSTSVESATEAVPYNYKQKYVTLQGMAFPELSIPKTPETTPSILKIGEYVVDGKTQNSYKLTSGPVQFTASLDVNGEISVSIEANDTINKIAANEAAMNNTVIPTLKQINQYDATKSDVQLVTDFVANRIVADLKKQQSTAKIEVKEEKQTPAKIEVVGPKVKDFSKTATPPNTEYRVVAGETERISSAEISLFKEWHSKNVPNIPYEVLENILITHNGEKAWGVFENGVAKFFKTGARGTEYHEIFEGVYKAFLSNEEQQALLAEFKAKSGTFTDRESGKKIKHDEATDRQAKERIADDFADFRIGKLPARSLGERIRNFFRNIMEFFKQFVTKPSKKQELFKAIDTGRFKEFIVSEHVKNELAEYRSVEGLTEQQTNEFVQDITARAFQIIFGQNIDLFSPKKLTAPEIFNQIKDSYTEEGKMELLGENTWNQLLQKTREFLRTFRIDFDENNILSINNEEQDRLLYAPEPFSTDWKKSSPFPVKLAIGSLTETVAENQENSLSLNLPEQKLSSINGYKLFNFSRAFATLLDKLGNTTNVKQVVNKLLELAKFDSNYVRLFTRLKGDLNTSEIDFSKFEAHDWRLFVNFYQTFTKQRPEAFIQYINNGEVYTSSANLFTNIKQVQRGWIENLKALSKKKDSIIAYNKSTKTYQAKDTKDILIKTPQQMVEFLSQVGVEFPLEAYLRLKNDNGETKNFAEAVSAIHKHLGSEKDIMSVTGKTLKINGQLTTLAELLVKVTNPNQDISYFGIDQKRRQIFADNNAASLFENEFNSVQTLDELLLLRPELNDTFSKNSTILKKGGLFFDIGGKRIRKIKVGYIQGTENVDNGRSTTTSALSEGDRFTQEINQNVNGNYYILVPADSSTEWMINLGNSITFEDVESGTAWNNVYSIFKGYLKDDIALAKENRSYLRNTAPRAQELRFFKDVLPSNILSKVNTLINNEATEEQIDIYINENITEINAAIREYIQSEVNNTVKILKQNRQIVLNPKPKNNENAKDSFNFKNLDDSFAKNPYFDPVIKNNNILNKEKLTEKEINDIITFTQTNYIINNIELHKILFGDPYQFAIKNNKLDETKRIKSFLSPRRTTFDTPEFNTFLNQTLNTVGGVELTSSDPGYHLHKSHVSTVTFDDVEIVGSLHDVHPAYAKVNEADAASWIMDNTYREVKLKNGQWDLDGPAEKWHQWQMAYTRQNMPGYKYSSDKLKQHDIKLLSKPQPKYVIEVLKPIVSGVKNNKTNIDSVLDKFSQIPIYYSMVEGTNLENLYIKMFKEQIGYGIVISGRKIGAEQLHSLYNEDGSFNDKPFNNKIDIPWRSYGIQVENSYDSPKEQTRGSQVTKLSSLDLFDNGMASPEAQREYLRNKNILNLMHRNGYKTILNKLGIEDLDGSFRLIDNVSVAQSLEREMLRREVSENMRDTVQLDENGQFPVPFEASSAYIQIKDILYSIVDKAIVSPKMSGASHVQVPVTMWEKSGEGRKVVEVNGKKVFTSSTLKFYTKEDPYMEVLLPAWFKDKLNKGRFKTDDQILSYLNKTEEGRSILKGIGFRIPTQSMSSIENIRVKGFLPSYMRATVVVPSEITTKVGSDFDIDKLNMYLKAVYIDEKGNIKLVKYKGNEEDTRAFYSDVFDKKIERKKIVTSEILEALQLIHEGREYVEEFDTKGLVNKYADILNTIISEVDDLSLKEEELLQRIEEYGDENIKEGLKKDFINEMYKRSLENEYYDSLEKLLTLPENFERLISPVDDAGLKKLSDKLDNLKGENEESIKNRLLSRNYMTSLRHAFVLGKKWVGIGAVNITGHSLTQKSEVFIDPKRFELVSAFDRKWLGDGTVALPHNSINGNISISATKTANGKQYISDRLSGYITSFVDVSKDPYILKIIKSNLAVGTFMFLERIGVGENTALFMNQPIIEKYLEYLDSINARGLYNKKNIDYIKSQFISTEAQIETAQIEVNTLSDNIKRFAEKGKFDSMGDNAVQHKVLNEFLKYAKMAEYSFKLTQASNYDTASFRSADSLFLKQVKTREARKSNIFSSVDKMLDSSYIGEQSTLLAYSSEAIGEILKLDQYDFRDVINTVLEPYAKNEFLSRDKYDRVANKVMTSFIDFVVQTKSPLNTEIKALLVDAGTSVADQLAGAKKEHSEIALLKDLEITSSDRIEGAKSIKLKANLKTSYDENLYTEMFRELKASLPKLYNNIVKLSILQGTYQSAISIANIIPIEDRAAIISPIIKSLNADKSLDAFAQGAFQRNNWRDDDIFHTISPKFFSQELPLGEDVYGNEIFQYSSSAFPNLPNLNIKSSDRKILFLSEKYNLFDTFKDFILVPRVVKDPKTGERVDMTTGKTVTNAMYKQRSVKGDLSLKDVFGYQKVKYADGSSVLSYDKDGNPSHIYKLINLWGDGQYASEYYTEFKPSVLNNGTIKLTQEIPDADIIAHYSPKLEEKVVPLLNEDENKAEKEILKEFSQLKNENVENTTEKIIFDNLPLITPASAKKETGLKTGAKVDINPVWLSVKGVSVPQAAHNIWNKYFSESNITDQDVKNIIITILTLGKKEFQRQYITDNSNETIPDCPF